TNANNSSIGISSSFNELKFDTNKLDTLMNTLKDIENKNNQPRLTASGVKQQEYDKSSVKQTKTALAKAGITKEKDHITLQADLVAQAEKIQQEVKNSATLTQQSQRMLKDLQHRLGQLTEVIKNDGDFEATNSLTGKDMSYEMSNEQLTAELLQIYEETKSFEKNVKGTAVKDSRGKIVPGRSNNFVQPLNSASDINASGQVGFTNAMYAKFEKIESDSEVTLDLSSYSNQTKKFVASNNSDQLSQSAAALTQSVERLDKSIENSANRDNLVNVALGDDIIKEIFQVGAGLGCVDILSDPRYCQGRTSLSSIATNHSALQTGRTGRGYTTSYQVEHNK
ncbi:MAG: hypothetical protein EBY39_10215, partial [Flavobacteriia bacterium]|nr:hypothetical protein [Flavobacteriia bacterium]